MTVDNTTPHTLDFASVEVTDLDTAAAFYTDILGFGINEEMGPPHARVFKHGKGAIFAIRTPKGDLEGPVGQGTSLWFDVTDIESVYDVVQESDAEVVQELEPGNFGPEFTVRDPDGYRLTFHENPESA